MTYALSVFGLIIEDFWIGVLRSKLGVLEMCSVEQASMG